VQPGPARAAVAKRVPLDNVTTKHLHWLRDLHGESFAVYSVLNHAACP
jgi:hypothetical protein